MFEEAVIFSSHSHEAGRTNNSPADFVGQPLELAAQSAARPTSEAVAGLRRISGLTWEQLARMFDVPDRDISTFADF